MYAFPTIPTLENYFLHHGYCIFVYLMINMQIRNT
ncbi:hypothetical protein T03_14102 [Trichinella britovi]|uniref:Uncharacterized protein n=1 Tax=Trichinella britovi TaxID=45882 RepID=A0A0V0YV87_TRIBR|nr:hypothetical protein T03_14102 [Trichinella britovi]